MAALRGLVLAVLLAVLWVWAPAGRAAMPPAMGRGASEVLRAQWLPSAEAFARGGAYPMAIRLQVAPGMHINAHRPDEANLIPTRVELTAPPGLSWSAPSFPPPRRVKLGFSERPVPVFDGAVLVRMVLRVAPDARLGVHQVRARISYQGCNQQMCLMPESQEITLPVRVIPAGQAAAPLNQELFAR